MPRWIEPVPPDDEPIDRVIVGVDLGHEESLAQGTPATERQIWRVKRHGPTSRCSPSQAL
jgi:hypothetical protein